MARGAGAYCRTSVCQHQNTGAVCVPARPTDCGIPIAWRNSCIGFSVQRDASSRVPLADAERVLEASFRTWMSADCGGGATPSILVKNLGPVDCREHEYNENQANANAIIFRDEGWPYRSGGNILALTTVTYNLDTGEIYDADMEINSSDIQFTVSDENVVFDLQSITTHETGHFLGLSHSPDKEATMFAGYNPKTTSLRDLNPDDAAGICAIYPPGNKPSESCDASPRHGFAQACAGPEGDEGCCTVAPGHRSSREREGWMACIGLGLLVALRRRPGR